MNIWRTPECDAWSRGFGYEDYLALHAKYDVTCSAFEEKHYNMLYSVFDTMMEDHIG